MSPEDGELQAALRHCRRLAALLFVHELTPPPGDAAAARWLLGRAAEVERYAESVLEDRTLGRLDDRDATARLAAYLASLHAGLAGVVGAARPSCCHPSPTRRRPRGGT